MAKNKLNKYLIIGTPILLIIIAIIVSVIFIFPSHKDERKHLKQVQAGEEKLNIIIISIDTLRADRLGCYGYENIDTRNIDALAAGGVRFTQCKAQVPLTLPSHTTMLTGSYPPYHGVRSNDLYVPDESVTSLAEILGPDGYDTAAFVSSIILFADTGINQGFDFFDDETRTPSEWKDAKPFTRNAETTWGSAENWLRERDTEDEDPFFMFLHFYDPHAGYNPPRPFNIQYEKDLYAGEIAYVDYILGDLIPTLKDTGNFDNTLIILTSDHGECLGEHGEDEHGVFVYESAVHVPMILYCPGLIPEGVTIEDPIALADIAPTIYDILGIEFPDAVQGESLIPQIFGKKRPHRQIYEESLYLNEAYGWGSIYAIEQDGYKYIECPKPELYDLRKDPGETENLLDIKPELALDMSEDLEALLVEFATGAVDISDGQIEARGLDELAGLGYFGSGAKEGTFAETPAGGIKDCKDYIDLINTPARAQTFKFSGEYDKAIKLFEDVIEVEPESAYLYFQISRIHLAAGDMEKSIEYCEIALDKLPSSVSLKLALASLYMVDVQYDKAETILMEIKDEEMSNRNYSECFTLLSTIHYDTYFDVEKALKYQEKAIEYNPNNRKLYFDVAILYGENKRYDEAISNANKYIDMVQIGPNAELMKIVVKKMEMERDEAK